MNLDALIADLEAQFVFNSNRTASSSPSAIEQVALEVWRSPGNLHVTLAGATIMLQPGFVARDFVAGLTDPLLLALRTSLVDSQMLQRALVIAPLGSLDGVERRASLSGNLGSTWFGDREILARLVMSDYLKSWLGHAVSIKTRANPPQQCTLIATARRFVIVENRGDERLIPVPAIEWLAPMTV